MTHDIIDTLASYRPTDATLEPEWSSAREAIRVRIAGTAADSPDGLAVGSPRATARRRFAPLLASAAVAAVAVSVGLLLGTGGDPDSTPAAGPTATGAPGTVGASQFFYERNDATVYSASGKKVGTQRQDTWVSPDGRTWERLQDTATGRVYGCTSTAVPRHPTVLAPTAAFLAGLPTDPARLDAYLRRTVSQPSISAHLAAAPSVRDMEADVVSMILGEHGLLAGGDLRSALLSVVEHIPGATVDRAATDLQGRPAIRIVRIQPRSATLSAPLRHTSYYDPASGLYVGGTVSRAARGVTVSNGVSLIEYRIVDSVPASVRRAHCSGA